MWRPWLFCGRLFTGMTDKGELMLLFEFSRQAQCRGQCLSPVVIDHHLAVSAQFDSMHPQPTINPIIPSDQVLLEPIFMQTTPQRQQY